MNYIKVDGENKCLSSNPIPDGYYLINNVYKKYYITCKSCSKGGINNIHNCNECIYGNLINSDDATSNFCSENNPLWYLSSNKFYCLKNYPEICSIFIEKANQCE